MRYLKLKSIKFADEVKDQKGDVVEFNYVDQIKTIMRTPANPQAGADIAEIERSLRVLNAVRELKTGDVLQIEDADWDYLCERVRNQRWMLADQVVVAFKADVESASDKPPLELVPNVDDALVEISK